MESSINTKDVDKLLKLYRKLLKSISYEPSRNKKLWEQCLEQAKKEYIDELKKHESQLSPPRTFPRKASKENETEFQKAFQHNTTKNAEKKYRQTDSEYDKAILKIEEKRAGLIKEIDKFQYAVKDQLIEFERSDGTLLTANWQKIMETLPHDEITQPNFQFYVQKSIDVLEAIKAKIERQEKTEIETTPAETEQKATVGRWRKIIGWIFKKTSHFICAIVVAVIATIIAAIIVDILADFGWIERIKEFFTK